MPTVVAETARSEGRGWERAPPDIIAGGGAAENPRLHLGREIIDKEFRGAPHVFLHFPHQAVCIPRQRNI